MTQNVVGFTTGKKLCPNLIEGIAERAIIWIRVLEIQSKVRNSIAHC